MSDLNKDRFRFTSKKEKFRVYAFSGKEEVNKPYEFNIELIHTSKDLDLTELLGTSATLAIEDNSGTIRLVHGIIAKMKQLHTNNDFTHYSCLLVPRLWFLEKTQDHRIFQNMTVVDIIQQLLKEQGFTEDSVAFKLPEPDQPETQKTYAPMLLETEKPNFSGTYTPKHLQVKIPKPLEVYPQEAKQTYPPREYCVQYGESILYFITRLCEEEGIYFYFEHEQDKHILCFCDHSGGPRISGESTLIYDPISGTTVDTAIIHKITLEHEINIHASEFREWDFTKPKMDLKVQKSESDHNIVPQVGNAKLEEYKYPHLYTLPRPHGEKYVNIEHLRHLVYREWIEVEASVSRFLPSYVYAIIPNKDLNKNITDKKWWVVSTVHEGKQHGVLEHRASTTKGLEYRTKVISIPSTTRFIPKIEHPKKRIDAVQTAVVTGPANEEIHTDKYGRVKVKFHWDRLGKDDESSSLWLRVSQAWSGNSFGSVHIPRIGQEVLVSFLEGNPDRPMVTGRVDNADNMPPWKLPEQRALSGIQSKEIKGSGHNQLIMDDTQKSIQTQLSSDHECSQLNLGSITRLNHKTGRWGVREEVPGGDVEVRGEGFELRTDAWGAVRAGKGLYISTHEKKKGESYINDFVEAKLALIKSKILTSGLTKLARIKKVQDSSDVNGRMITRQVTEIQLTGNEIPKYSNSHIITASAGDIISSAAANTHLYSTENMVFTSGENVSINTKQSFVVSALNKIGLYAHKQGFKIFSKKEDLELTAEEKDINLTAGNDLKGISKHNLVMYADNLLRTQAKAITSHAEEENRINGKTFWANIKNQLKLESFSGDIRLVAYGKQGTNGGKIRLNAKKSIVLNVGKSYIAITDKGIEISAKKIKLKAKKHEFLKKSSKKQDSFISQGSRGQSIKAEAYDETKGGLLFNAINVIEDSWMGEDMQKLGDHISEITDYAKMGEAAIQEVKDIPETIVETGVGLLEEGLDTATVGLYDSTKSFFEFIIPEKKEAIEEENLKNGENKDKK